MTYKCSIRKYNTLFSTFIVLIKNKVVHLHQITMNCIAKIMKMAEKTNQIQANTRLLPMQGYMSSLVSRKDRAHLKLTLMTAMGVASETTWWRWVVERTYRPTYAQREAAAEVIRHHSGNEAYTGEDLFPEYLYKN